MLASFKRRNARTQASSGLEAGHRSNLASLRFGVDAATERRKHTQVDFCGLRSAFEQSLCFRSTGNVWTPAYSRPCYRRQNARVEHSLLEQLTLFPNASIVLEDVDTHRSDFRRRVNAQTKRRQSHVNAGRVPESENARTKGRPVAGFRRSLCVLNDFVTSTANESFEIQAPDSFVRVLLVDYSKAFDHINHELLITKLCDMGLLAHLVRWMAAFLIDRQQSVKIGDTVSNIGYPNGSVPQGTLSRPKNFLVQINYLQTPCPIFKYVDDSTVFDVCNNTNVPMLQESTDVITDWSRRNDMRINARKT